MNEEPNLNANRRQAVDIMVVDDDHDLADSLAQLLKLEGYTVATAYSAEAAVMNVKQRPVAVALVDIRLGRADGVGLIGALKTCNPEIVVIMMTAYASIDTAVQALQEGAYDYLCKPFLTNELLTTLQRCFERVRLFKEREEAEAAVHARNLELRVLNLQLSKIVRNMQTLGRCGTVRTLGEELLSGVVELLESSGGAFYVRDGDVLRLVASRSDGHTQAINLRPDVESSESFRADPVVSGHDGTQVVFPLFDVHDALLGALLVRGRVNGVFSQQAVELAQILVSFGEEAIRAVEAAENLAESEERLRKIIKNSPSAIALKGLNECYLLTNDQFDDWFRICIAQEDIEAVKGEPQDCDHAAAELVPDAEVLAHGHAVSCESEITLSDGAKHSILMTRFQVVDGVGQPVGIGTIATDTTEQRLAEQRLRQAQRLEALGQLTGGIAHDFNNLLSVILGSLRILEDRTIGQTDVQEHLEEALDATKAGAELTSRLLAFGRGQMLLPEVTDLRMLVVDFSQVVKRTLGGGIIVRLELPSDLWHAELDRNQLRTGLLNIAINARDAMPDGGELVIGAQNVVVDQSDIRSRPDLAPGDYVVLSTKDSGGGMSPDVLRKAIQPFFTTKGLGQGTGLGLSMVYGFVKQSKGHMELTSKVGEGTTVSLFLPAGGNGDLVSSERESVTPAGEGKGERILVVEDQPSVRRVTRRLLMHLGYEVLEASDGRSARKILDENSDIDVLFTDIVLPGKTNGVMLGREALAAYPDLHVIYTTGYAVDSPAIRQHLKDSTTVLLHKPVQAEILSRALRSVLERH